MTDKFIVSKSELETLRLNLLQAMDMVGAQADVVKKILGHSQVVNSDLVGWKYYYKVDDCPAANSHDGNCMCWHHEGTGKFPNARHDEENTLFEWKLFTTPQPAPDTVPREEYDKLLDALKYYADKKNWSQDSQDLGMEVRYYNVMYGDMYDHNDVTKYGGMRARQAIAEAEGK